MLPGPLVSIYRQYKADTDSVASWIASTAKACGYPGGLLASKSWDVPAPKSGRLKGKARKEAGKANKDTKNPQSDNRKSKYVVALDDYLALARFIAQSSKPLVSVPDEFSATLNRLIAARAGFGQLMEEHGAKSNPKADLKHGYFVGILEAVRDALRPSMTVTAAAEAPTQTRAGDVMGNLTNRFVILSVEQPSQAFLDATPSDRPKPQVDDPVIYEAEQPTSFADVMFAFTCLINDLNRIRSRIEWTWLNHRDGFLDLTSSAVATNTAISLARGLIDDIAPLLDAQDEGAWGVTKKFFAMCCLRKGYKMEEIYLPGEKDNFNDDLYDIADGVYIVPYRLLVSFLDVINPRDLPLYKEGMFGQYDPHSDRASKTGGQKFQEDQIVLMEFFTELMTVIRAVPGYPVEDEFLCGMRELDKTYKVPFSLVFAAQIFLDIHHIMRDAVRLSFSTMIEQFHLMETSIDGHLTFHEKLEIDNWPTANDHMLQELLRLIKWMGKDPVYLAKVEVYSKNGMAVSSSMEAHRILIYSPVLAGLLLFKFRAEVYEVGISAANAWGSIAYSAHLYNALRAEKFLTQSWRDMDIVLTLLRDSNFWVGERPRTAEDYFRRFCFQMGCSVAAFTNPTKRRRKTALASRAGPRGIKDGIPVSSMFKPGFTKATADVDWTAERIDDIVARSEYRFERSIENGAVTMTQLDEPIEIKERNRAREQKVKAKAAGKKSATDGGQLVPEKLVEALVLALHAESLEMAFPYLTLHRFAWRLLRAVKDSCDPVLRQLYTPRYIEKETELPWVVGYIFMAASGVQAGVQDYRPMKSAVAAFESMIGTGAGQISVALVERVGFPIQFVEEEDDEDGGE